MSHERYRSITINDITEYTNPVFEGWLEKKSRYLKSWRKRYGVVVNMKLYTYKSEKVRKLC